MNTEDLKTIEDANKSVQLATDFVLGLSLEVIEMAYTLGQALQRWKASLPPDASLEQAAESDLSPELHAWLDDYLAIAALPLSDNITESKPRLIQQAMKILELIPPIITKKETHGT